MIRHLITGWFIISLIGYGALLSAEAVLVPDGEPGYLETQQGDALADLAGTPCADHCGHGGQHLSGLPTAPLPDNRNPGTTPDRGRSPRHLSFLSPPRFRPPIHGQDPLTAR